MSVGIIETQREVRDYVMSQLAWQIEAGVPLPAAAQAVRDSLPAEYQWATSELERLFAGGPAPTHCSQLEAAVRVARSFGIPPERMLPGFARAAHGARLGVTELLSGARSVAVYLLMLSGFLAAIAATYSVFVLPQLRELFTTLRARLPAFTEAMIGTDSLMIPGLALLVALLVVYLIGLRRFRRRMQALEPVYPLLRRVPGLAAWAKRRDETLWLRYYAVFLDAAAPDEVARHAADQLAGEFRNPHRTQLLAGAARLGSVRAEIGRVLDIEAREDIERFEQSRGTFVLALRVLVYVVIGIYVLAMYLPIFKLGAAV